MEELVNVSYTAGLEAGGRKILQSLSFTAGPGDNVYLYGGPGRCRLHYEVLCGLRKPDMGSVMVAGQELYAMSAQKAANFRRDRIGAIPEGGGLIREMPMITQVAMPMKLAGLEEKAMLARLEELVSDRMPLHSLYSLPGRCNARKRTYASIFRAVIRKPEVLILNGFGEELDELDADALWEALLSARPEGSVLICLSGAPAPEQAAWTRQLRL